MAPRGADAQKQLDLTNQQAANQTQTASNVLGLETPALTQQLQHPGFDPGTADAIRRSGMDTTNSAFDAAKFSAAQRAGATGNDAMFYGSANDLAQKRAARLSTAATNAETTIGKQAIDSQQQAIQDASQLYGTTTGSANSLYGQGAPLLNAKTNEVNASYGPLNSVLSTVGSVAGGVGGLLGGIGKLKNP